MGSKQNPDGQAEKLGVPIRLVMLIPVAPSGFLLLSLFAGLGWAMLFVALLHLLLTLIPLSSWLGRLIVGANDYELRQNTITKTKNSLFYKVFFLIGMNLFYFFITFVLFNFNIRLLDFFS
jgi:hypothetical protein